MRPLVPIVYLSFLILSILICSCQYGKLAVIIRALCKKIKAHLEAASFSDPIDAYECLGNKFANDTAQQVNTVFCLTMVSELEALHKRNSADKQRLEQVFSLMLALTDARQKLPIDKIPSQDTGVTVDGGSQSLMWIGLSQHRWIFHRNWIHVCGRCNFWGRSCTTDSWVAVDVYMAFGHDGTSERWGGH